jgi:hypothetical protein
MGLTKAGDTGSDTGPSMLPVLLLLAGFFFVLLASDHDALITYKLHSAISSASLRDLCTII